MHNSTKEFNWKWQLKHRLTTPEELANWMGGTDSGKRDVETCFQMLPFAITPYYATVVKDSVLRKTVLPSMEEQVRGDEEFDDPLGEERHRVAPHLIHTYPDKVLFLPTTYCSTYCRYCTRSRLVGATVETVDYEEDFVYIEQHPEIRDVLVSGGDPLTFSTSMLDRLLGRIRKINHVQLVRIGSKVPAVLPMRIDEELCRVLRKHHVWLSLHFTHPDELTEETVSACQQLADHGISMVSQTVLLKGVNDSTETLRDLFYGLLAINVKPYYLLQCDPVVGTAHFRTSVERGVELIRAMHGNFSGLAVPQYVIDAPGGGGKVPIVSMDQLEREGNDLLLINYQGKTFRYPDPKN